MSADFAFDDEPARPRYRTSTQGRGPIVGLFAVCLGLLFCLTLYFIPTGVALIRGRTNTGPIAVVNLFLGWTLIGFVVAMSWAVATDSYKATRY